MRNPRPIEVKPLTGLANRSFDFWSGSHPVTPERLSPCAVACFMVHAEATVDTGELQASPQVKYTIGIVLDCELVHVT